jgi:hypothetical protein
MMLHNFVRTSIFTSIVLATTFVPARAQYRSDYRPYEGYDNAYRRSGGYDQPARDVSRGDFLRRSQVNQTRPAAQGRATQTVERMARAFCSYDGSRPTTRAYGDRRTTISSSALCAYHGGPSQPLSYSDLQPASPEAQQAINEMLRANGVRNAIPAFVGPVGNAEARFLGNKPVIIYSPSFFQQLEQQTGTRWSIISVLAHEIGHHANFDTLTQMQGDPHPAELRADYFSGSMMARLGASLDDALVAQQVYGTQHDTQSHPAKDRRLAEIESGYKAVAGRSSVERPPTTRRAPQDPDDSPNRRSPTQRSRMPAPQERGQDSETLYPTPGERMPSTRNRYPAPTDPRMRSRLPMPGTQDPDEDSETLDPFRTPRGPRERMPGAGRLYPDPRDLGTGIPDMMLAPHPGDFFGRRMPGSGMMYPFPIDPRGPAMQMRVPIAPGGIYNGQVLDGMDPPF